MVINNGTVKSTAVWSADRLYLVQGVLGFFFFVLMEAMAVREFFVSSAREALGVALVLQIPAAATCLLSTVSLKAYKRRAKFPLHFCRLENADIKALKQKYHICFIDEYGVVFIDMKDHGFWCDWKLMHTPHSTREMEGQLFAGMAMEN